MSGEFVTTACLYGLHDDCDDLACMCEHHDDEELEELPR